MSLLRPDERTEPVEDLEGPRHKHPLRHRIAVGFTVLLAVVVVIVGAGVVYAAVQNGRLDRYTFRGGKEAAIAKVPKGEPVNILVVGNDSRSFAKDAAEKKAFGARSLGESLRSDTMMVMRLDPKNDRAQILSIARDLWVDLEGGGKGRINEAFAQPGNAGKADPDRLVRTIRSNFGLTINHYLEIDFAGFRQVVDAIGGVSVYFPFPARDAFSNLDIDRTGCVKLDGGQALSYVRSRHYEFRGAKGWQSDPSGDIGRIQRQQDFIKRVVRKAVAEGLNNPVKAAKLIEAGVDNVKVDSGFGVGDMKKLANQLRDLDDSRIAFLALTGDPVNIDGNEVLKLNQTRANEALAAFGAKVPGSTPTTRRGTVAPTIPSRTAVVLYNGSGRNGLVAEVQDELQRLGVRATSGGNGQTASTTQVRHRTGNEEAARAVKAYLGGEVELVADRAVKNGELIVLLGETFTGVVDPKSPTTATTKPPATTPAASPTTAPPKGSDPSVACP